MFNDVMVVRADSVYVLAVLLVSRLEAPLVIARLSGAVYVPGPRDVALTIECDHFYGLSYL